MKEDGTEQVKVDMVVEPMIQGESEVVSIGPQGKVEIVGEDLEEKESEKGTDDVGGDSVDNMADLGEELREESTRDGVEAPEVLG